MSMALLSLLGAGVAWNLSGGDVLGTVAWFCVFLGVWSVSLRGGSRRPIQAVLLFVHSFFVILVFYLVYVKDVLDLSGFFKLAFVSWSIALWILLFSWRHNGEDTVLGRWCDRVIDFGVRESKGSLTKREENIVGWFFKGLVVLVCLVVLVVLVWLFS